MSNESQQIIAAIERMTRAFQAGDIEAVMACYTPDAAIVFEPGTPVTDRAAQAQWFSQAAKMKPQFTYAGHDVVIAGDLATHLAPWTMRATGPGGEAIVQAGLSVAVLRRDAGGAWRIAVDHPYGDHLLSKAATQ